MSADIYQILDSLSLPYTRYDHPAVFTCEAAEIHCAHIPGGVCKNLFLRNRKGDKHFLVVVSKDKKADLKKLEASWVNGSPLPHLNACCTTWASRPVQ